MRYTEFEGIVCHLGEEYDVAQKGDYIYVVYEGNEILEVSKHSTFRLTSYDRLKNCSKKQEVWNAGSRLAATPLDEREEEKKYNVIIGNDGTNCPYIVWGKDDIEEYFLCPADSYGLREYSDFEFTESEYQDLLKYIKSLPQGDKQVEIAKIGKTLVND